MTKVISPKDLDAKKRREAEAEIDALIKIINKNLDDDYIPGENVNIEMSLAYKDYYSYVVDEARSKFLQAGWEITIVDNTWIFSYPL